MITWIGLGFFSSIEQRIKNEAERALFRLIQSLYSRTTSSLAQTPSDIFEVKCGVRQGGPESPLLYNLLMDYVMRIFIKECSESGVEFLRLKYRIPASASKTSIETVGHHIMDWLGYADDLVLMLENKTSLRKSIEILNETFQRFGLEINVRKTKTMIINYANDPNDYPDTLIRLNNKDIDNVKEFIYLGCKMKFNESMTGNCEVHMRVDLADSKFYELGRNLMNKKILLHTRTKFLNDSVRSRLTYACQSWNITQSQFNKMSSTYYAMLRKMIKGGYRRIGNTWRYALTNKDLLRISNTEDVSEFVKRQQRNYVSHIIRQDNESTSKRLMFNDNHRRTRGPHSTLLQSVIEFAHVDDETFMENAMNRVY